MNQLIAYGIIVANIIALLAAAACFFRRKHPASFLAFGAMLCSLVPFFGGLFFPTVTKDFATGVISRTWFFYASHFFTFCYFVLLALFFFKLQRVPGRKETA